MGERRTTGHPERKEKRSNQIGRNAWTQRGHRDDPKRRAPRKEKVDKVQSRTVVKSPSSETRARSSSSWGRSNRRKKKRKKSKVGRGQPVGRRRLSLERRRPRKEDSRKLKKNQEKSRTLRTSWRNDGEQTLTKARGRQVTKRL